MILGINPPGAYFGLWEKNRDRLTLEYAEKRKEQKNMKLWFYKFDTTKKEVIEAFAEVEEKPKTYKVAEGSLPFMYISKIPKEYVDDKDLVRSRQVFISKSPDFATAVRAFRAYFADRHEKAKIQMEQYDDFYKCCFHFHRKDGSYMVE